MRAVDRGRTPGAAGDQGTGWRRSGPPIRSTSSPRTRSARRWPPCGSRGRVGEGARFATVTLDTPAQGGPVGIRGRRQSTGGSGSSSFPVPRPRVIEATVDVASGNDRVMGGARSGVRPALLFEDSLNAIIALRANPEWQEAIERRGITDFDKVQIDPWPTGNFGRRGRDGTAHRPLPGLLPREPDRQRLCPAHRRGGGHRRRRPGRGARGGRLRGRAHPHRDGQLPARGPPATPRRPSPPRDPPARGAELHRRGQRDPLAGMVNAGVDGPERRPRAPLRRPSRTRGRPRPFSIGRRSPRWSSPTATRARCTDGRTPSTPASGDSGGWSTHWSSAVTASAPSITWTPPSPPSGAIPTSCAMPSASTRRTTGSSGSTRTCTRAEPRCVDRAGWWCPSSPRWATTSTASTGTSTSTAPSSSR